jgi:hypothetical protein
MRDYLLDIVEHTHALGCIDLIKITGDDQSTQLDAVSDDKSVVITATFKKTSADFVGTFGMPNLNKLATILGIPEYKENAKIQLINQDRNGQNIASGLHFENEKGDFKNDYRFMTMDIINDKLKSVKFKGVAWNVEFEPTNSNMQRFKFQAAANSDESQFIAKTENNNLVFYFGDHSTHAGNFVFHTDVKGTLNKGWHWPVARFIGILNMYGDKKVRFSDEGAAEITVDSGLLEYRYIIPAQSK